MNPDLLQKAFLQFLMEMENVIEERIAGHRNVTHYLARQTTADIDLLERVRELIVIVEHREHHETNCQN